MASIYIVCPSHQHTINRPTDPPTVVRTSPSVEAADRYDSAALCPAEQGGGRKLGLWRPPPGAPGGLPLAFLLLLPPPPTAAAANETEADVGAIVVDGAAAAAGIVSEIENTPSRLRPHRAP